MAIVAEAFQVANRLYGSGNCADAENICRLVITAQPDFAPAWILLGRIAMDADDYQAAAEHFRRATELDPTSAATFNALGAAVQKLGQHEQAITAYRRALELKPDFAEAHYNCGRMLKVCGNLDDAVASLRRAIELKSDFAEAHYSLGKAYQLQGDWNSAKASYCQALEASPNSPALVNEIGIAFKEHGLLEEAIDHYRSSLDLKVDYAPALVNLGAAILQLGHYGEAIAHLRQAVSLNANCAEAHSNLAAALRCAGHREEAVACCRRALELKPDLAEAHLNLAALLLLTGDFESGWHEYEWHWRTARYGGKPLAGPKWNGEPLDGKAILLHSKQGLGDTIQFVRYASLVKRLGAKVIVSCQDRLLPLLTGLPVDRVVSETESPPAFDFHAPLLGLPRIFKTKLETIPADFPYLFADAKLVEHWRQRLHSIGGFKVGIVWQGNPHYDEDHGRSLRLSYFQPLASVPGVRLISLQKGPGTEQMAEPGGDFPVVDFQVELDRAGPFLDTAAIMKNLDLVITSDTAAAHLAGALGVRVWVALRKNPNWRWLLDRPDSPWYPTMRLFRQKTAGDWPGVFNEMAEALRNGL